MYALIMKRLSPLIYGWNRWRVLGMFGAKGTRFVCPADIGGGEEESMWISKSEPAERQAEISK
jgi:hypothetical protein